MQADLGVPVWRKTSTFVDGCGAVLFSDNDVSHGASCVVEPGIWHPTSPADLAAMRERIDAAVGDWLSMSSFRRPESPADAVMAAIFGSSANGDFR